MPALLIKQRRNDTRARFFRGRGTSNGTPEGYARMNVFLCFDLPKPANQKE